MELATILAALAFVITLIRLQIPVAAATGSAVLIVAVVIILPSKGKPGLSTITPAWQAQA